MSSQTEICNSALISLAEETINTIDDDNLRSKSCKAKWEICRRTLLRMHPWNFATVRSSSLARSTTIPGFEYTYQYALPPDCLRVRKVDITEQYKVEGRYIITSAEEVFITYIKDETDTNVWDPAFTDAMTAKLAYELAYIFVREINATDYYQNLFNHKLKLAKQLDGSEDIPDALGRGISNTISARYRRGV